ncbi:MAG TPA: leucyl aminopeptidase [Dehalococcoidia bacterium]|nr:leucyl aminopeptidase [Dehalococcoidia bacterium]
MEIQVETGDIAQHPAKAIIVNLFEGVTSPGGATGAVDKALGGGISQLIAEGEIKGKKDELTLIHTLGRLPSPRVLVAGLGKQGAFGLDTIRDLTGAAVRRLRRAGATGAATIVHGAGIAGLDAQACAQAVAEGALMGAYRFTVHKQNEDEEKAIEALSIVERDGSKLEAVRRGVERGRILAEATNHARDLANEPANVLTPTAMAERAQALAAEAGLECQVLEQKQMEELGMGALLGVAAGSVQPPKFIVLRYRGKPRSSEALGLLGKGITFDSGGISIKPAAGMEEMKGDMSGGAAIIAAMWALGKLRPAVNVTALVPTTENMPSGSATKPGDVLRAMNGKTIEVINTDAEGRLVLADAICYARREKLSPIIDVATLTGAMQVALGPGATGFMATDDALAEAITRAGAAAGERMWRFPLIEEYREHMKSDVADIKNTGNRFGGAINAAKFLHFFVEDTPWVHIDMAPTDNVDKDKGAWVKGATGIPTRTLIHLVLGMAE